MGLTNEVRKILSVRKATPNWEVPGCYIDESGGSADELARRVIEFARGYGFDPGELPDESNEDYGQIMYDISEDAVSFLNDNNQEPNSYWEIDENSLFLRSEEPEN